MSAAPAADGAADAAAVTPVLVSACLLGVPCRFDGADRESTALRAAAAAGRRTCVPCCPEEFGGLPTPRPPNRLVWNAPAPEGEPSGGDVLDGRARVMDAEGADRTREFLRGAELALALAGAHGCREAWLKGGSPACGATTLSRAPEPGRRPGQGVAAAVLARAGLTLREFD